MFHFVRHFFLFAVIVQLNLQLKERYTVGDKYIRFLRLFQKRTTIAGT